MVLFKIKGGSFENVFNFGDLIIKAWPSIVNFVCSVNKTFYETYFVKAKCKTGLIKKQPENADL